MRRKILAGPRKIWIGFAAAAVLLTISFCLLAFLSQSVLRGSSNYRLMELLENRRTAVMSSIATQQEGIAACARKTGEQQGSMEELVKELPALFYEMTAADKVALTGLDGIGVNVHGNAADVSATEAYEKIVAGADSAVGIYEEPDGDGVSFLMLHAVERGGEREFILAAAYEIEDISEYLLRGANGVNDACLLIDRKGDVLMRTERTENWSNLIDRIEYDDASNAQSAQQMQRLLAAEHSGVVPYEYYGEKWYCAFTELGLNDWLLAYRVNAMELEYVQGALHTYQGVLYLVLLAILIGLAVMFGLRDERMRRDRRLDEQNLRAGRECLRILGGHPGAILCDTDLRTNKTYLYGNYMTVLGRDPVLTNFPFDAARVGMIGEEDAKRIAEAVDKTKRGMEGAQTDITVRNADGQMRWCRLRAYVMRDENGEAFRVICRIVDQKENAGASEPVQTGADEAGLMSRHAAQAMMDEKIRMGSCAMLLVDIDNSSRLAEKFGNEQSEKIMAKIGEELTKKAAPGEIVARLGGDEFAILVTGTPEESALRERSERVQALVAKVGDEFDAPLTASVGSAVADKETQSFDELYFRADTAQYMAKQSGRKKALIYRED